MRHLIALKDLSADEINGLIVSAEGCKRQLLEGRKSDKLKGKNVVTAFYENSTRTRLSFETAASYLGADIYSLSVATSSVRKGESLIDTGKTLKALCADIVVIRHEVSGAPLLLSKEVDVSVVNAGDGMHEHPTQCLLDLLTMKEVKGKIEGLKVSIVGDIAHSRVARSNIIALKKLGAAVTVCGPKTLVPMQIADMGAKITFNVDEAIKDADIVMGLRLQNERQQGGLLPNVYEYNEIYGLSEERLKHLNSDAYIMHPGPVNRGVEIDSIVADGPNSLIDTQVLNGVAVRMAVFSALDL